MRYEKYRCVNGLNVNYKNVIIKGTITYVWHWYSLKDVQKISIALKFNDENGEEREVRFFVSFALPPTLLFREDDVGREIYAEIDQNGRICNWMPVLKIIGEEKGK